MSMAQSFRHIPDVELITWYAENNRSVLSSVSPWSKVVVLILIVLLVTTVRSFPALLLLYGVVAGACLLARLPMHRILLWYTLPALFVLSLVGIIAWGEPGKPLLSFGIGGFIATLTDQGLFLIGTLLVKALIVVTYSLLFLMTTRYNHLAGIIDRVVPDPLNQIFLLSYRFLFLTILLTGSLIKAVRSRGGGMIHSLQVQGRIFARVFALVFIRSFDRAERVHAAMTARGYRGMYATAEQVPSPTVLGMVSLVLAVMGTVWYVLGTGAVPGVMLP